MEEEKEKLAGEVDQKEMADEAQDSAMPSPPDEPVDVPANSSDSDSDSDSDSEAQDKLQIEALESELYSNPSNYDAHLQVPPFSPFLTSSSASSSSFSDIYLHLS